MTEAGEIARAERIAALVRAARIERAQTIQRLLRKLLKREARARPGCGATGSRRPLEARRLSATTKH